ncbi:M48 family metallopeptidase [Nocardia sp. NPDC049149]|uniref:M48 family metallopeptidase n=1 Tax=Nocardia sp. NPDC049149 TaxID=3364315 RepID=UPI003720FB56
MHADTPPPDAPPFVHRRRFLAVVATLVLGLPTVLLSAMVIYLIGALAGEWWAAATVVLWLCVGGYLFDAAWFTPQRGTIAAAFGCRLPTEPESARLTAAWANVTRAPGVDGWPYALRVQNNPGMMAFAMPTRIVAVASGAIATLEPRQLEAILAHELGHHVNVDPRVRLLDMWVDLPGRPLWAVGRLFGQSARWRGPVALVVRCVLAVVLLPVAVVLLTPVLGPAAAITLGVLLVVEPFARAARRQRDELAADRTAVELGYGPDLAGAMREWAARKPPAGRLVALRDRLLYTHPPLTARIRAIEAGIAG